MKNAEYYAAVAQVIPLLFIAIAFEFRFLTDDGLEIDESEDEMDGPRDWRVLRPTIIGVVGLVATAVLGEAAALKALAEQSVSHTDDVLIVGTLATQGALILVLPLLKIVANESERESRIYARDGELWSNKLAELEARSEAIESRTARATTDTELAVLAADNATLESEAKNLERAYGKATAAWSPHLWLYGFSSLLTAIQVVVLAMPLYAIWNLFS